MALDESPRWLDHDRAAYKTASTPPRAQRPQMGALASHDEMTLAQTFGALDAWFASWSGEPLTHTPVPETVPLEVARKNIGRVRKRLRCDAEGMLWDDADRFAGYFECGGA